MKREIRSKHAHDCCDKPRTGINSRGIDSILNYVEKSGKESSNRHKTH